MRRADRERSRGEFASGPAGSGRESMADTKLEGRGEHRYCGSKGVAAGWPAAIHRGAAGPDCYPVTSVKPNQSPTATGASAPPVGPVRPRTASDLIALGSKLYKAIEARLGPRLPRSVRAVWRRAVGRPPLPDDRGITAAPVLASLVLADSRDDVESHRALRHDVVCFPIIAWDFRFQRPQQLMREMARAGHRVFYVNPTSLRDGERMAPGARGAAASAVGERIFDVRLAALSRRDHFRDALEPGDVMALLDALDDLRRRYAIVAAVSVAQLPFWAPLALAARERFGWRLVYDCMDDHAGFSSNTPRMLAAESDLLARSDLVVATSKVLMEAARSRQGPSELVPNACEFDHFARAQTDLAPPPNVAALRRPTVGYFGAISEWFDFELLRHAASAHPEWDFLLIGSTWGAADHRDLAARANVHFLGEKPYESLPAYLSRMDACVIPFRITPLTRATNPVKLYEYFAAGKPVVASPLPEIESHRDLIEIAATPETFTVALERALREDSPARRAARIEFARRNDWSARRATFASACETTFPLASIVVVTWNNLALTERCLASVLADGSWPRFEVIVVDNASSDGTPARLRDLAARDARIRLVCNDENRGFAAANNQGIAAARGDFLVLLNNDTEVTRGWLARLLRALEADDRLGLVGPVTNSVWNEARQEVRSADLARLPEFAERWAAGHLGKLYPIKMLAMFCIATRRAVVDRVGPLDERFRIGMLEDDDYSHRVRLAGYRIACLEEAFVLHAGQASFKRVSEKEALQAENQSRFEEKWNTEWRPYIGSRTESLRWRGEIARLIGSHPRTHEVFVFLPRRRWDPASARHLEPIAVALARAGHLVLFCLDVAPAPHELGLLPVERGLYVANLPLESFEGSPGLVAVVRAGSQFELAFLPEARVVYEVTDPGDDADERRRVAAARAHDALLHLADVILCPRVHATDALLAARPNAVVIDEASPTPEYEATLADELVAKLRRTQEPR
jgi:GT2 family glycosyltransferase/glycosyltransferase involved in cell wall biosynthesis